MELFEKDLAKLKRDVTLNCRNLGHNYWVGAGTDPLQSMSMSESVLSVSLHAHPPGINNI